MNTKSIIEIFRGDDSDALGYQTIVGTIHTDLDLTGCKAVFRYLGFFQEFDPIPEDGKLTIVIPSASSMQFPPGFGYASLKVYDIDRKVRTFTNRIPVFVKTMTPCRGGGEFDVEFSPFPELEPLKIFIGPNAGDFDQYTGFISKIIDMASLAKYGLVMLADAMSEDGGATGKAASPAAVKAAYDAIIGVLTDSYYTKSQTDEAIDKLAAYYITADAQGNPFATHAALVNATTYYSGGSVRTPTRNDYAIVVADETHNNEEWRYIYSENEQGVGQWEPQYAVEGVITFDDNVTRTSANGVKSSGIWSALWGALAALPTGFTSLYDWCVAQLSNLASKTNDPSIHTDLAKISKDDIPVTYVKSGQTHKVTEYFSLAIRGNMDGTFTMYDMSDFYEYVDICNFNANGGYAGNCAGITDVKFAGTVPSVPYGWPKLCYAQGGTVVRSIENNAALAGKLDKSGGTMTGPLTIVRSGDNIKIDGSTIRFNDVYGNPTGGTISGTDGGGNVYLPTSGGTIALVSDIPAVVAPSTSATTGQAAGAKATGDALAGKLSTSGGTVAGTFGVAGSALPELAVFEVIPSADGFNPTMRFSDGAGVVGIIWRLVSGYVVMDVSDYLGMTYRIALPSASGTLALDTDLLTKLDASSASDAFSPDPSVSYPVGSHCTYRGKLYKCTTATTGGTWVAGSWTMDTMTDPDAVLDITAQNQLRVVAKDGTLLWAQGYDLASTSSATLACDATNNFTFADGATTQAFTLPTAPTGKVGDFGLDIDNSANTGAATMTLTGLDTTFSVVVPEGESLNDMLAIAAGELARFYITLSTFRVNNLPTWHIVKQIVENGGATA